MEVTECIERYDELLERFPVMKQVGRAYVLYCKIFDFTNNYSSEKKLVFFRELETILKDMTRVNTLDVCELVDNIQNKNPYYSSVFTEPTNEEWLKVQSLFKSAGLVQDRYFGSQSRLVWNNCCAEVIKRIQDNVKND